MSQKTNPTSLRLQKNFQNFASPWFADCFWSETYQSCFEIQKYITAFLKETSFSKAFFSAKMFYQKFPVFIFLQDNRVTKKEKLLFFKKSLLRDMERKSHVSKKLKTRSTIFDFESTENQKINTFSSNNLLFFKNNISSKNLVLVKKLLKDDFLKTKQGFFKNLTYAELDNSTKTSESTFLLHKKYCFNKKIFISDIFLPKESVTKFPKIFARPCFSFSENIISSFYQQGKNLSIHNTLFKSQKKSEGKIAIKNFTNTQLFQTGVSTSEKIRNLIEKIQERKAVFYHNNDAIKNVFFPTDITLEPIRFIKEDQNVAVLADLVVTLLERRVSFRQIKSLLFKDLLLNPQVKGVRISCSGRLGGRSKKAQKAKIQSGSCGATTLAAFSSKILFASKSAYTSYGKVGVKIWLSFDDKRCFAS